VSNVILETGSGSLVLPAMVLVDRADGGHLVVNPPRVVWDRSELNARELALWSFLVASAGRAMMETLPQLAGGCINYWDAGNWSLHHDAEPPGLKDHRVHRQVHLHLLGRSPGARSASWQWGEAPRFPEFRDRVEWARDFAPLTDQECAAVAARAAELLHEKYETTLKQL
jgi:diadenosine tetraphosphate (Ap4A) HIT family hydrolase